MQRTASSSNLFPPLHPKVTTMCEALKKSKGQMMEADTLLSYGIEMLKKLKPTDSDFQKKIDQIMVGTMVCVMITQDTERKNKSYPTPIFYQRGGTSMPIVSPIDNKVTHLKDDLSWCEKIFILPITINSVEYKLDETTIYLQEDQQYPDHIKAMLTSKFEMPMEVYVKKAKILEVLTKYNLNFEKLRQINKSPEHPLHAVFINEIISCYGYVNAPLYSYIPIIGKHILEDKILPFNTLSAATQFPDIYLAYGSDYLERFKSAVTDITDNIKQFFTMN